MTNEKVFPSLISGCDLGVWADIQAFGLGLTVRESKNGVTGGKPYL